MLVAWNNRTWRLGPLKYARSKNLPDILTGKLYQFVCGIQIAGKAIVKCNRRLRDVNLCAAFQFHKKWLERFRTQQRPQGVFEIFFFHFAILQPFLEKKKITLLDRSCRRFVFFAAAKWPCLSIIPF